MDPTEPSPPAAPRTDPADPSRSPLIPVLIPPVITGIAILVVLGVARIYEQLPLQAPACGLRVTTGIPCVACGGTRSMMALAHGRFTEALAFNPLLFLGVILAVLWLLFTLVRVFVFRQVEPRPRRLPIRAIVTGVVLLFLANWIYLWVALPE